MEYLPFLEITRGEFVESLHIGAIAVSEASGTLVAWWGDPESVTYLRSTAKPIQALPLIESGAAAHFDLQPDEVAVICASHSGTDDHVAAVRSIQEKIKVSEEALLCGTHPPHDLQTARRLRELSLEPTVMRHNCSGKHMGMLALARFLGESIEGYTAPTHPVQRYILKVFVEMCGLQEEDVTLGVDGCSVPTFAVPLHAASFAYARLVDPVSLPSERAEACRQVVSAMTAYPDMVAGPKRFDTILMKVADGKIVAKGGAEGYQGLGILPGALGEGSPGLGVAIKVADGDLKGRARPLIALAVLEELGALTSEARAALAKSYPHEVHNNRGIVVGRKRPTLQLVRRGQEDR
ncbi:MAG: asparaginase [Anaerolineales bacterium]|nr:asparaginase [Anaerolineales bacterium]